MMRTLVYGINHPTAQTDELITHRGGVQQETHDSSSSSDEREQHAGVSLLETACRAQ